jgi:hypothetical protein
MSWTYEPGASNKDTVRLLIGDTDEAKRQLHDEEVAWFLSENSNVYVAASEACKALAALYAREVDKQVGDLRISASQRQAHYATLSKELRRRAGRSVSPYFGGISISDKDSAITDTDRVRPAFFRGMFDHRGGADPSASTMSST